MQDRGVVTKQIRRLHDDEVGRAYQRALLRTIQEARQRRGAGPDVRALSAGQDSRFLVAVTGEILVGSTDAGRARALLAAEGFAEEPVEQERLRGLVARFVKPGADVRAAGDVAAGLRRRHGISASVNYVVPLGYVVKGEGGFEPTDVARDHVGPGSARGTGVPVAVVDTGIAETRRKDEWLVNVAVDTSPWPLGNVDPVPTEAGATLGYATGHGQFCAGIVQQVCRDADIRVYRAVDSDGIGSELAVADAVLRAADDGAKVINLSLGTETVDDLPPVALEAAIDSLHPDVLVVAAAGNSGGSRPTWPASIRRVISVGSLTADGLPSTWSNHGPTVSCSLVGEGVVSTFVHGTESSEVDKHEPDVFPEKGARESWALGTGTSYAAPQVTGLLAEQLAATPEPREAWRAVVAENRLRPGVVPGHGIPMMCLPGTPS